MKLIEDEEIEVLDLEEDTETVDVSKKVVKDDVTEEEPKKKDKKTKSKKNKKEKKVKLKKHTRIYTIQLMFCVISALFILGCFVFYGERLFKYYRVYNPKPENGVKVSLLANEVTSKSEIVYEDSGLYISGGNYIYKGEVTNNYLRYANMLWRIVRVNNDDTVEIILDDYINVLNWDNEKTNYLESDIYNYLNEYYIKTIDKDLLNKYSICTDKFDDLNNITCEKKNNDSYVNLLDVTNFLNSIVDGKSYLSKNDEIYWLRDSSNESIWHTNGYNVSMSEGNNFYEVRPVVVLKPTTPYYGGSGTLEEPFVIEKDEKKIEVGSYVKLGEDTWVVYNNEDNLRLTSATSIDKQYRFSNSKTLYDLEDKGSIAEYLNTEYLGSLSYKDILIEGKWSVSSFKNSYTDVLAESATAKVGMLNLMDIKINSEVSNYMLTTANSENLMYTYGSVLKSGKPTIYRNIRPCIIVSKDIKINSGEGTIDSPYVLEV